MCPINATTIKPVAEFGVNEKVKSIDDMVSFFEQLIEYILDFCGVSD